MSKRETYKDFYAELEARGLLDYGSIIESSLVYSLLKIEMPQVASKKTFDQISLIELAAIDYVRNILLGQGKYIGGTSTGYRIFLPSETADQIELYMAQADRKLSRALKLTRSVGRESNSAPDQTEARILMKLGNRRFKKEHVLDAEEHESV